jgi:hypothetical protein
MTQRDRVLLTIVVPLLLAAGLWFALVAPQRKEAARLDGQIAAAQSRLSSALGEIARARQARSEVAANLSALTNAGRAMPAETAMEPLLRQLQASARHAGVHLDSIGSAPAEAGAAAAPAPATTAADATGSGQPAVPDTTTIDLTMTVKGHFFAMERFFTALQDTVRVSQQRVAATGRLLTVRSISVTSDAGVLTADVEASAHVLTGVQQQLQALAATMEAQQ